MALEDRHRDIDSFLLRKWEHAFLTFFDVNRNGTLEWDDFQRLITIIGDTRGVKSDEYVSAKLALPEIWHRLTEATGIPENGKMTLDDWIDMWAKASQHSNPPPWQHHYLDYMFQLFDASGDKLVDLAEYIQVMQYFQVPREEATNSFDKFALNDAGEPVMCIDFNKYYDLWETYFHSTDMNDVGNYLFGFI